MMQNWNIPFNQVVKNKYGVFHSFLYTLNYVQSIVPSIGKNTKMSTTILQGACNLLGEMNMWVNDEH